MKEQKLTEIEIGAVDEARKAIERNEAPAECFRAPRSLEREVSNTSGSSEGSIKMILTFVEEHPKKIGALVASLILALLLKLNVEPSN